MNRLTDLSRWHIPILVFFVLGLSACKNEPLRIKVTGNLTRDGQPLKGCMMVFHGLTPEESGKTAVYRTSVEANGFYRVPGPDGRGIPPGKYRIVVQQPQPQTNRDLLNGVFGPEKSPIVREIPSEPLEQRQDIELSKPTG